MDEQATHVVVALVLPITAAAAQAGARGETIVQVHGQRPFAIRYVNPADNPQVRSK